ncbi:MAG: DUF309 domain-containing protein [Carbonactinosporaceae bacterium]
MTGRRPDRDRDAAGRPHSARPRDASGRPLARDARGVAGVPDDLELSPDESVDEAQRLLDQGMPFHAHEVFEATWKSRSGGERPLWQGLAQLAVGLTHAQRGNARGAAALLRRGAGRIAPYTDAPPCGLAAARLVAWAEAVADRIDAAGLESVTPEDYRPRLR